MSKCILASEIKNPRPVPPENGEPEEKPGPRTIAPDTCGHSNWLRQLEALWKRSDYPATINNFIIFI
jgi:hypothetical protein